MNAQTAAFVFASALERLRPLTMEESDMLCTISVRGKGTHKAWTAVEDRQLQRLIRTMRAPQVAEKMGRTAWAVRSRVRTLKARERARG